MSMIITFIKASGRARCKICWQLIARNEIDLVLSQYHETQHYHYGCISEAALHFESSGIDETYTFKRPERIEIPIIIPRTHRQVFPTGEMFFPSEIKESNEDRIK